MVAFRCSMRSIIRTVPIFDAQQAQDQSLGSPSQWGLSPTVRWPSAACRYKAIGGGSPLRRITEEQGAALARAMQRKGTEASVYVAMRYWKPFTEDAIEQVPLQRHLDRQLEYDTTEEVSRLSACSAICHPSSYQSHDMKCVFTCTEPTSHSLE